MKKTVSIPLSKIILDAGTQIRANISEKTIDEYAERLRAGDEFPPVILFFDKAENAYYMGDGFHRFHAHKINKKKTIQAEIRKGDLRDAILFAVMANTTHGRKRTNADKRRAVKTLLIDDEWGNWSDREIAKRCAVDHKTVGNLREKLTGEIPSEKIYKNKHGQTAMMNTENIGQKRKKKAIVPKVKLTPRTQKLLENYSNNHGMDQDRVIEEALKAYLGKVSRKK